MADQQDRNLPASHRRIAKAREDGQVARSRDLAHLLPMAAGVAALVVLAPLATHAAGQLMATGLRFDAAALATPRAMLESLSRQSHHLLAVLLPLGLGLVAAAVLAAVLA
ncbi:MAG TPA: EscU/YscU/HrcU family type III secretion system export apparatus switch protein, partial [Burkholderiaceae bacterium]|nr:EscU/YscU/HrcU family type III secretion system export apparatus switch protein [Burkholderiaceae bacterium]